MQKIKIIHLVLSKKYASLMDRTTEGRKNFLGMFRYKILHFDCQMTKISKDCTIVWVVPSRHKNQGATNGICHVRTYAKDKILLPNVWGKN